MNVLHATTALILMLSNAADADEGEILRGRVSCSTIIGMVDGGNKQAIGYVGQFITDMMYDFDKPFVLKRKGSVMDPLSYDGLTGVVAITIVGCRKEPSSTVDAIALQTYAGIRSLNVQFGLLKP